MREHIGITDFCVILKQPAVIGSHLRVKQKLQKPFFPFGYGHKPQLANAMLIHWDEIQIPVDRIKPELGPLGCVGLQQCLQCDALRLTK